MPKAFPELAGILKHEPASVVRDLERAAGRFFDAVPEDVHEAAQAVFDNVKRALSDYETGQIGKADLEYILNGARDGYLDLAEAQVLRIRKSVIRALFGFVLNWVKKKL